MSLTGKGKEIAWVLAVAAGSAVLLAAAVLRGAEYDENYTLLLAAGTARPAWPAGVFTAGAARVVFDGHAGLAGIARDLRDTDVHPPLYFWLVAGWRWLVGPSLFAVRLLSVLAGGGALALVGALARRAGVSAWAAVLLTVGCYGFAYTGAIARGFAVAQVLTLAGVWLAMRGVAPPLLLAGSGRIANQEWEKGGERRRQRGMSPSPCPPPARGGGIWGLGVGLFLGAATLSNYLAAFVAGAVLVWLPRRPRVWVGAVVGFAAFLPADLWFFLAQRNSRPGQYPPISLADSLPRLARYAGADLFGGLPLYVGAAWRSAAAAGLGVFAVVLLGVIVARWRQIGTPPARVLFALAAMAPPVGLLGLGVALGQTPIELRYLAFSVPFVGLLLAGALGSLRPRWRMAFGVPLGVVQVISLIGMMTRPETMQPARGTAAAAARLVGDGVVLLPRGNDGVGVVGAFLNEAPDSLRIAIVDVGEDAAVMRARAGDARRVVLALIGVDVDSRATVTAMRAAFANRPCWREAGSGFNVLAYDRVCEGNDDVLRRLHAEQDRGAGR